MNAINENQHNEMLQNLEMIVRSDRVFEKVYDSESEEVISWTEYFYKRAKINSIFYETWERLRNPSKTNADVVGTFWHHFSALAPQVMSLAAYKVSNNLIRHYIVQVIFEELGSRSHRMVHSDIFLDCLSSVGTDDKKREELVRKYLPYVSFDYLQKIMSNAQTDSHVLGILLGLEIDAEENIKTIYDALSFDKTSAGLVEISSFFRIHKIVESEHIRLNVANFLRFCPTETEKTEFIQGFDEAVLFWKMYWSGISSVLDKENRL
jgi:hypothetical protein